MRTEGNEYLRHNRALWNAKLPVHVQSSFYRTESIVSGADALVGPELAQLSDLHGQSVLHLQCHFGLDSIHLARLGAAVTGLDLSDASIEMARSLSARAGVAIDFICADVYTFPERMTSPYDLVFSTYGTIGWLPDMQRWADVVSGALKEGGRLLLAEFHPQLWMYDDDLANLKYSYFNRGPIVLKADGTYTDRNAEVEGTEVSWNHSLAEVMQALIDQGMEITRFEEYDYSPYPCFPDTIEVAPHRFQIKGREGILPMMYLLEAKKVAK